MAKKKSTRRRARQFPFLRLAGATAFASNFFPPIKRLFAGDFDDFTVGMRSRMTNPKVWKEGAIMVGVPVVAAKVAGRDNPGVTVGRVRLKLL